LIDRQAKLSLPAQPGPFLEQLGSDLDDAYQRTREGLTPDHPVHDLAAGELRVEQLDALPEPASLSGLRERIDGLMPPADLPDLVLEIAAKTGFIDGFTNDQEPSAQLAVSTPASAPSSSRRPATSATSRSLTRATRRSAKPVCGMSRSATCGPRRSRRRTPGSSTSMPSSASRSAGAVARSRRSMGCGSSSRGARSTPPTTAATSTVAAASRCWARRPTTTPGCTRS